MSISINKYDSLEAIIFNDGLTIKVIYFHQDVDLMLIMLNTTAVLHQKISTYPLLKKSTLEQLKNYELIGNGAGVHWLDIEEDLSLKGFLQDEIRKIVGQNVFAIASE